jgi:hypothetical protein
MTDQGVITIIILAGVTLGWMLGYLQGKYSKED